MKERYKDPSAGLKHERLPSPESQNEMEKYQNNTKGKREIKATRLPKARQKGKNDTLSERFLS